MVESNLALSLANLSNEARTVLSRLNTKRLIPSDRDGNLPRDYRGLAFCVNIMAQDLNTVHQNQTEWLLRTWLRRNDGTATVKQLVQYLELIDRFDVKDDLLDLDSRQNLITESSWSVENQVMAVVSMPSDDDDLVTMDDIVHGIPVIYDALVLYALADKDFVDLMITKMRNDFNLKLCTKHSLRPGMMPYPTMTELISNRCRYVILVYSEDFFESTDEKFYMDFVHAWNINTNGRRLLPCMYRQCALPAHYSFYHNLYYNSVAYDFWAQLGRCLVPAPSRAITSAPARPAVTITEIIDNSQPASQLNGHVRPTANGHVNQITNGHVSNQKQQPITEPLTLPSVPNSNLTVSMTTLSPLDSRPIETLSLNGTSNKKKKSITKFLKKPFKVFGRSKTKSQQALVDYSV